MNASQQHLLDTYFAARRGEAAPPAPDDLRAVREIRTWRRFQAVVTDPSHRPSARAREAVRHYARALRRVLAGQPAAPSAPSRIVAGSGHQHRAAHGAGSAATPERARPARCC